MCLLWFYSAMPHKLQEYNWRVLAWSTIELLENHYTAHEPISELDRRDVVAFNIDERNKTVRCYVK